MLLISMALLRFCVVAMLGSLSARLPMSSEVIALSVNRLSR
jgi:hypothetical protein